MNKHQPSAHSFQLISDPHFQEASCPEASRVLFQTVQLLVSTPSPPLSARQASSVTAGEATALCIFISGTFCQVEEMHLTAPQVSAVTEWGLTAWLRDVTWKYVMYACRAIAGWALGHVARMSVGTSVRFVRDSLQREAVLAHSADPGDVLRAPVVQALPQDSMDAGPKKCQPGEWPLLFSTFAIF